MKQVRGIVSGRVQGVGFRFYTCQKAKQLGLRGYVKNLVNGDVEFVAQGDSKQVDKLIEWSKQGSPPAKVNNLAIELIANGEEFTDFEIRY